jgi:hypothetical protein
MLAMFSMTGRRFAMVISATAVAALLGGCPSGPGGSGYTGDAKWPKASGLATTALPAGVNWQGVWFINTAGSRGTMHLFTEGDDKIHGCWIAEDKHSRATFVGSYKDNLVMLDWTEKRVGFAGAPVHVTGYFLMKPDPELGKDTIAGEYGADASNDSGNPWQGIRLKNQDPKPDGCNIEEGETVPVET